MLTYEITPTGYRILREGAPWIVQEGEYADVYPGETMEERAQAHLDSLQGILTPQEQIAQLQEELAQANAGLQEQLAINDILTGGDGNGADQGTGASLPEEP